MRRAALVAMAAVVLLGCCSLLVACNSLGEPVETSTTVLVDETTEAPTTTIEPPVDNGASDQALLGEWTQLSPAEGAGSTFEFFANGAVAQVLGPKIWNYTYTTTDGNLSFINSEGVTEASHPFTVAGDTLTILNPNVTYIYARGGATIDEALVGVWTQISPAEGAGSVFDFSADGTVVQMFGSDVWDYSFTTGGNNLSFINSEGVIEAAGSYAVAGDTFTFVNSRSGIVYEHRSYSP